MDNTVESAVSLKPYNTFGVDVTARRFVAVRSVDQLATALRHHAAQEPLLVLGRGSNMLFTRNFDGLVLKNDLAGITVQGTEDDLVRVRAAGGEDWHAFVCWCLKRGFYGLENLSLIPGTVGAAPVQNIGAYGVEVGDMIDAVEAMDLVSGEICRFEAADCAFAYRSSIFKERCRNRFFITAVTFRLFRTPRPVTTYADVRKVLAERGALHVTPQQLSDIICAIRRCKLPNPDELANAGSFFKNPVVSRRRFHALRERFPDIPAHPVSDDRIKLAAGWMIERCGWKGRRMGPCGVYAGQALVLVNHGGATGRDLLRLAEAVQSSVEAHFAVRLEPEPLIL